MRKTVPVLLAGATAAVGLLTVGAPALAAPSTVNVVTHTSNHPDTTYGSVAGCTTPSDGGPVWAYDNMSLQYSVTPESGPGNYSVTITAHGSFSAFADPTTGACISKNGSVDGTLQWDVSSTTPPDPKNVPSQEPGDLGQTWIMINQLFDGNATTVGGGHYSYTYNRLDSGKYTQVG
jgi:hypothetical protein